MWVAQSDSTLVFGNWKNVSVGKGDGCVTSEFVYSMMLKFPKFSVPTSLHKLFPWRQNHPHVSSRGAPMTHIAQLLPLTFTCGTFSSLCIFPQFSF